MTTQPDWAAVKAAMLSVAQKVFGELPRDRKVRCPFHADKSPSLHVYDDGWHCYGCGEHGDAVDLVVRLEGIQPGEAYRRIIGDWTPGPLPSPAPAVRTWTEQPGAEGEPVHWAHGIPQIAYPYHRGDELVGYVCRWDTSDGKMIRPATSVLDLETGELRWEWVAMQEPRPLYRPDHVGSALAIVEGEKAADHLRAGRVEACTWPGGSNAWAKADWTMVTASRVILWPDADEPGRAAMDGIAGILVARGIEVAIVDTSGLPTGSDAADLPHDECIAMLRSARPYQRPIEAPPEVKTSHDTPARPEAPPWPFRCLGHADGWFYFLESERQTVVRFTAAGMTAAALLELAPLGWWEAYFPKAKQGGIDVPAAADALIRESRHRIYTDEANRGRGIWYDAGRIIYHAGDQAIVDGTPTRLTAIESRYAYPVAPALPIPAEPLSDAEAQGWILDTIRIPSWHEQTHAEIVAGWTMCALLAGVLRWRPSIWITGAAGTGKTSIMRDFLGRLLGPFAELAQGNSSEAGIRQRVRSDARPIVMDEAEPARGPNDQRRWTSILDLMRQASSDSDARTLRGTPGGHAQTYHVRAPFAFGSIQCGLSASADRDRVSRVSLRSARSGEIPQPEAQQVYADWLAAIEAWPNDIADRLLGRALAVAPVARQVAASMGDAMMQHVTTRREADQLGALMAGAWLLQSSAIPTADEAAAWVGAHQWDTVHDAAQETDAEQALASLLGLVVQGDRDRASIADRIAIIDRTTGDTQAEQERVLAWYGLRRLGPRQLFVAHTCDLRREAMKHTAYADVTGLLRQLPGTVKNKQSTIAGKNHKGVIIDA